MTFSSVTAIKTRYRSQLKINAALRLGVTTLDPDIHNPVSINETNVHSLEIVYNQLIEKIDCLKFADNELLSVIDVKDIEKEVEQCESFMENLISYKCKISQKIASLTPPIVPPTIVNTTNLPSSTIETLTHEPRSSIKLPKLTVNKFYGDHKNWLEFLSQIENAVDKNSSLSKIEKLIYLKSLVGDVAAKAISGCALTEKFSRKNKSDNWDLKALREFLGEEIQSRERERAQSFHSSVREKQNSNNSKQECNSFAFGSRSNNRNAYVKQKGNNSSEAELLDDQSTANSKCIFCGENLHDSSSCESVSIEIKRFRFFCFSGRHSIAFCSKLKKEKGCSFCGLKSHSKALCYRFYQNNSDKTTFHCHKEESDDSITSVSSCQTETESQRVLLQTASVVARYNKQFRNCRLLADTAAQRSLVERKFSRLLTLPVIRKEKLSIYSFGDKSPVEKVFNVVKIRLENKDDPNSYLEIEALETENIRCAYFPA
ncbi:integrase catalytic domain-containing protein [Trichonephila clavipes]|uniref:Integrase catalytic domain-containing protein n=1 Tax=Trichonephila clavipes TaxID=2585209 RepID=A0A8X6WM06_TRICX|nr:integrase catalytic domain-containing protein [Trichonephila clavipes]